MGLINTALNIARKGWTKDTLANQNGNVCTLGALYLARVQADQDRQVEVSDVFEFAEDGCDCGDCENDEAQPSRQYNWLHYDPQVKGATEIIQKVIAEQYPGEFGEDIPAFNDAMATSFDDVERVLEKAALLEEEQELQEALGLLDG